MVTTDKAPGPDGFNFAFIKAGWEFLKEDLSVMLSEFYRRVRINREMNATFITLILEVVNPMELHDYRPITLVGCLYKLLAKVLANRLKQVLPSIIGPFQGAFVAGRQILDGVLIDNELIDSRKRSKDEGVIFKIDLEKAYDHVEWHFVDYMLFRFGFGEIWRRWNYECISTTSFSVFVNGSPSRLFKATRVILHGDPFSPFLFTMVVEALSSLLVRAKELGLFMVSR